MASEAVVPDQSTDEHVDEKKANNSTQNVELENVSQFKKNEGSDVEEKVNEKESASEAVVSESEKKIDDEKIDIPAVVEAMKAAEIENALGSDDSVDDGSKVAESSDQTPIISPVSVIAVEVAEKESGVPQKIFDVLESSTEAEVEKLMENVETSATPESELKEAKHAEVSEAATEVIDKPKEHLETSAVLGSAPDDEMKPENQSEISDVTKAVPEMEEKQEEKSTISVATELAVDVKGEVEKKIETLEAEETAAIEVLKDDESLMDKIAVMTDSSKEELSVVEKASLVADPNKFEKGDGNLDINAGVEDIKEQESKTDAVEVVVKDVSGLDSTTEVTKDSIEGEKISRDVEMVTEGNAKEIVKGVMPTSVETSTEGVEGADSNKPIENPKETELEGKLVEPIVTTVEKLEETTKPEALNLVDTPKDGGDKETAGEVTKQEVSAKPAHRQSNNIISKVKQSMVKVKKAIMGKSSSSKTVSSEDKGETKEK